MVKQIYNARNGRSGRNGRVTALSREAHRKNPYSALFRYCEEDDIEEEVNKDDEDSETEPTSTKKTAVVPKVVGRKPKAASKANTNKRQRRQVSTDDDDISYLDEQIKNNKTSTTGATTKVSTPKKGKAKGKGSVSKKSSASAKKPANSAKKSHKNAAENEVDDEIDFDDLHKTKEGERISSANHHTSSSKNTEINELKSRISAMDIRNQKLEDLLERRENQLAHQTSKNAILNKKLELANQYIDKSNLDDGQHTMEINERHLSTGKKKCVKAFRIVKFLNNEAGLYQFGDMIMDMMGDPNLTRSIRDSDEDKRITEDNRNIYRRTYQIFWRKCINNHRTEVQVTYIADFSTSLYLLWTSPPFFRLVTSSKERVAQVCPRLYGRTEVDQATSSRLVGQFNCP